MVSRLQHRTIAISENMLWLADAYCEGRLQGACITARRTAPAELMYNLMSAVGSMASNASIWATVCVATCAAIGSI